MKPKAAYRRYLQNKQLQSSLKENEWKRMEDGEEKTRLKEEWRVFDHKWKEACGWIHLAASTSGRQSELEHKPVMRPHMLRRFDKLDPGGIADRQSPSSGVILPNARDRDEPMVKQEAEPTGSLANTYIRDRRPDGPVRQAAMSLPGSREPSRRSRRQARARRRSTVVPSSQSDKVSEVLNHIDGYADLLLQMGSGGAGDGLVKEIAKEIKRMIGTVKTTPSGA